MKWTHALSPLALALLAACGDYSNDDLVFRSALPTRDQVASKAPSSASDGGTGASASALSVKTGGGDLGVGQRSDLAALTTQTSVTLNGFVFGVLDIIEGVVQNSPTTRAPDRRVWGPYPAKDQPGNDVRLVVTRSGADFSYRLEFEPTGAGDSGWFAALTGTFNATNDLRHGLGSFSFLPAAERAHGLATPDFNEDQSFSTQYDTRLLAPLDVQITIVYEPSLQRKDLTYEYREAQGSPREMSFDVPSNTAASTDRIRVHSLWLPSGKGHSEAQVFHADGTLAGDWVECWDDGLLTVYQDQNYNPPATGDRGQCQPALP